MPGRQLESSGDDLPESLLVIARYGNDELEAVGNM